MSKIYLTPYNKPAMLLAQELLKKGTKEILFLDTNKYDNITVFHPLKVEDKDVQEVLIISENYYEEIYKSITQNVIAREKVFLYDGTYQRRFSSLLLYKLFLKLHNIYSKIVLFGSFIQLLRYKNIHLRKRCFIIGNGPSLQTQDLEKLKDEICFASNKIYLAFDQTQWRPTYYFVEDHLVLKQNYEKISQLKGFKKFLPDIALKWAPKMANAIYYKLIYNFKEAHFSDNPHKGFYWGASVTYSMIEMAAYMGFKEIYLIGVDFSFENAKQKLSVGNDGIFLSTGEKNHFHKAYRTEGEQWTVPDMAFQKLALMQAKAYMKKNNKIFLNVSRKTKLNILDKTDLENILQGKK
ncbi:MAG: 6-hydroxymethylpterin diphosphokinase MptE-like protein [Sulfurimonadaceae bacterium]